MFHVSKTFIEDILVSSIKDSPSTAARIFEFLAADYIEGYNDEAGEIFNKYFPTASLETKIKFAYNTPFRKFANKIARNYGFLEPWIENGDKPWEWLPRKVA